MLPQKYLLVADSTEDVKSAADGFLEVGGSQLVGSDGRQSKLLEGVSGMKTHLFNIHYTHRCLI